MTADMAMPSLRNLPLVCPRCHGVLEVREAAYSCRACDQDYPLYEGVPDFRLLPDPFLGFRGDYVRAEKVLAVLEQYDLKSLLEYYWTFSDITPVDLRRKFVRSVLLGEQSAQRLLRVLHTAIGGPMPRSTRVLEIGSGTGSLLAVGSQHYEQVVGCDIAMRWLHVSRRRFMDGRLPVPPLICCCGEYLPFEKGSFDLIVMAVTLEFVQDPARVFAECARVLSPNGILFVTTNNRYSLARDPYAYLWGVGFLPRRWQARYVAWRRHASYEHTRMLSYRELNKLAAPHFTSRDFLLPDIDDLALANFPPQVQRQVRTYRSAKRFPPFAQLLKWLGPGWDAVFRKA